MTAGDRLGELLALLDHERPLEDATATAAARAWTLERIATRELYRAAGFDTFADYCHTRWNITPSDHERTDHP